MKTILVVVMVVIPAMLVFAQHGTAPNGYYPMGYSGDTWKGTITAFNPETREVTLTYQKKNKTETFTGVLRKGCMVTVNDGSKIQDIPIGAYMVAYYRERENKVDGKRIKYNEIFRAELARTAPQ